MNLDEWVFLIECMDSNDNPVDISLVVEATATVWKIENDESEEKYKDLELYSLSMEEALQIFSEV